jgi:hypothetical protein
MSIGRRLVCLAFAMVGWGAFTAGALLSQTSPATGSILAVVGLISAVILAGVAGSSSER